VVRGGWEENKTHRQKHKKRADTSQDSLRESRRWRSTPANRCRRLCAYQCFGKELLELILGNNGVPDVPADLEVCAMPMMHDCVARLRTYVVGDSCGGGPTLVCVRASEATPALCHLTLSKPIDILMQNFLHSQHVTSSPTSRSCTSTHTASSKQILSVSVFYLSSATQCTLKRGSGHKNTLRACAPFGVFFAV